MGDRSVIKAILTPMQPGALDPRVVAGAATVSAPWAIAMAPADICCGHREVDINLNRHRLQRIARGMGLHSSDIVLLLDSDVIMPAGTAQALVAHLLDSDCICAAAMTQGHTDHVLTACAVIRWEHYELLRFWDNADECQCKKIAQLGRVEYVSGIFCSEIRDEKGKL